MIIRKMTTEDVPEIAAIEEASFSDPWSADAVRSYLAKPFGGLVAEEEGRVAGYLLYVSLFETADLDDLAVGEPYRRKGIAKALMAEFLSSVRENGAREVFLEVRRGNESAIRLYRGCGFTDVRIRKEYYVSPVEDAVVMRRALG